MSIKDQYELSIINIILKIRQMKKSETMSPEQLESIQRKRFEKQLKNVIQRSEFYKNYYQEHGVNLEKTDQIALEDLPIIDKSIMMEHFDQFVCDKNLKKSELEKFVSDPATTDKKYKGKYEVMHTSGSSGKIGIFVYGPNDWSRLEALVFTRVSKNKLHLFTKTKHAFIGVTDGHYAGISLAKAGPKRLFDFLPIDINRPIPESVADLNEFMPDSISGYASGVYLLALEQMKGNLKIRPERILCSADPLSASMAEVIHKAFDVKPIDYYAATESLGMAAQCDFREGLHMFNDWHIFEVIKQNGELARPGETGNLILTTLYNDTQPLIRYRMDDKVILEEKECPCGWSFPLFRTISGREEEFLIFKDPEGNQQFLHPIVFVEFIVVGLEKLQVIQVEQNKLRLNVIIRGESDTIISKIKNRMDVILTTKKLIGFVGYEIAVVDNIPNDPKTGKFRLIVPLKQ